MAHTVRRYDMKGESTMTKDQANAVKKVVKKEVGNFTFYYNSKAEELRITVAQWPDGCTADVKALEERNILNILSALTRNDLRPRYERASKRYQGFINCRYLIFK